MGAGVRDPCGKSVSRGDRPRKASAWSGNQRSNCKNLYKIVGIYAVFFIFVPVTPYLFFANKSIKVANGPKNNDSKNQFSAVLFFP